MDVYVFLYHWLSARLQTNFFQSDNSIVIVLEMTKSGMYMEHVYIDALMQERG